MHVTALEVLDFWFGPPDDSGYARQREAWFRKDDAFDVLVAQRFGPLIEKALAGGIDDWVATSEVRQLTRAQQVALNPLPALAQVIVLDQFTRNAFRGSARAFAGDAMALQTARALVAAGADRPLTGVQRMFAYLPFEHAEDLSDQHTAVQLFQQLGRDDPALAGLVEWAQRHHDVVARFGRFPHRNAALGRASTPDELTFLQQPSSQF